MADNNSEYEAEVSRRMGGSNPFRRRTAKADENPEISQMRANRAISRKVASAGGGTTGGGGNMQFATGRPRDPLFYWKQNNLPYDVGEHNELKRVRAYCNTPEAPVWMGDYSFKSIGDIVVGDEVIGWFYKDKAGPNGKGGKVLTRTKVLAVQRRIAPEVVKVTFESGRTMRCTPDHQWANPFYSPGQVSGNRGWRQPEFYAAKVGRPLVRMVDPTPPLESEKERLVAAWLGGVYDGEGCGTGIAQSTSHNPDVCQRIADSLDFLGLPWTQTERTFHIRSAGQRKPAAQHLINFLNWTQPVRRTSNALDKALLTQPQGGRDKVVSIESEGPGEVVSMQTETGNYTAWGFASKNCRLLYMSHPMIGSCVDIYSKWPLLGMELQCFAGETEILTKEGTRKIADLAGTTQTLLTTQGHWVEAPVKAFGQQRLLQVRLRRNGREKIIYATRNHRWFAERSEGPGYSANRGERNKGAKLTWEQVQEIRETYAAGGITQKALGQRYGIAQPMVGSIVRGDSWKESGRDTLVVKCAPHGVEVTTENLVPGDHLTSVWARSLVRDTNPSPFGIAHGVTWGDGALATSGGGAFVDLYGAKDVAMLKYFQNCTVYDYGQRQDCNLASLRVASLPAFFKRLPDPDESTSYLYGFLAGWFAADGTVSADGTEAYLDCVDEDALIFARSVCQRFGIKTYAHYTVNIKNKRLPNGSTIRDWTGYRQPFDVDSLTEAFFCIEEHRRRWNTRPERNRKENWTVVSVTSTARVDEVYCAVVPEHEAFALEDNILVGNCKDSQLQEFYTDLFFNEEGLNYKEFLIDVGREYWTVGESWPFGSFNESLGIWEDDELLNPDDVEVQQSPFLKEPRFLIKLPKTLREVIQNRSPAWEFAKLMDAYPELAQYTSEDALMPVSNILLRQMKFKGDTFNKRGVPILMRAMRSVMQEEMMNSAMDAVADRLYTPLILVKLGASATDLGTSVPWIPTEDDLADFNESLDMAMAGDFRVLTHHFGIEMESVFGRENMPDMSQDFERLEDRILQTFGLSRTMLTGASCLTGDTQIHVSRAGKGFTMAIQDVVARFNGDDAHLPARRWQADISTYVACAEGGVVRQGLLGAAWQSGIKEVFEMRTASGRSVKASAKHPFLTESGQWVELGDLTAGDRVQVNSGRSTGGSRPDQNRYKMAWTRYHPYQHKRGMRDGKPRYSTAEHRAVMEAEFNGLSLVDFLDVVRYDEVRSKELIYIDPQRFHVHHQDENKRNNELANLALLVGQEHLRHHAAPEHVLWQIGVDEVVSITSLGEQMTYDLGMLSEPHNFLADDFVVHNSGETYAADALNKDLVAMLLTTYQDMIKKHYRQRALIVAEAQEHYDYDVRNGKRYVKMEEILEVDEETGEERIVEQPKLLVPDLVMKSMNLSDEQVERDFLEQLRGAGVPISMRTRMINLPIDFDDEVEQTQEEQVQLAIAEQNTRKAMYQGLRAEGLPIPDDLRTDFEPVANTVQNAASEGARIPVLGTDPVTGTPNLAPTAEDLGMDPAAGMPGMPGMPAQAMDPAASPMPMQDDQMTRPPESDEMRAGMPKPASLFKNAAKMREVAKEHHVEPSKVLVEVDGVPTEVSDKDEPSGGFASPRHVNLRRHAAVKKDVPMDEWDDPDPVE